MANPRYQLSHSEDYTQGETVGENKMTAVITIVKYILSFSFICNTCLNWVIAMIYFIYLKLCSMMLCV